MLEIFLEFTFIQVVQYFLPKLLLHESKTLNLLKILVVQCFFAETNCSIANFFPKPLLRELKISVGLMFFFTFPPRMENLS